MDEAEIATKRNMRPSSRQSRASLS